MFLLSISSFSPRPRLSKNKEGAKDLSPKLLARLRERVDVVVCPEEEVDEVGLVLAGLCVFCFLVLKREEGWKNDERERERKTKKSGVFFSGFSSSS